MTTNDAKRRERAEAWLARMAATPALQVDTAEAGCDAVEYAATLLAMLMEARASAAAMHRRAQASEGAEARLASLQESHERECGHVRNEKTETILRLTNEVRQLRARLGETPLTADDIAGRLLLLADRIDHWGALTSEKCGEVNASLIAERLRLGGFAIDKLRSELTEARAGERQARAELELAVRAHCPSCACSERQGAA